MNPLNMFSQKPTHSIARDRQPTSFSRVVFCWVLCLSVWRGPVPVVHAHTLDLISLAHNSQLAEHAVVYHSDCLGNEGIGLHFHFMLLDHNSTSLIANEDVGDSADSNAVAAVDSFLKAEQQHRVSLEIDAGLRETNQSDVLIASEDLRYSATADAGFLQTRISNTPFFAVLCVCLC